jgi:hypothetical protein
LTSLLAAFPLPACRQTDRRTSPASPAAAAAPASLASPADPFDAWLRADFPVADGFGLPAASGGDARAVGHGRVASVTGATVVVEHVFYDNHERRHVRSVYERLVAVRVREGALVRRGDVIGTSAGPHDEVRLRFADGSEAPPAAFSSSRPVLAVPQGEPALLLVSTESRRLRVRLNGEHVGDFEVAFGQEGGRKRRQGDLRTPLGVYFVVGKSRGPFGGPSPEFYGGHWIKINYPNGDDAEWGRTQGLLTRDTAAGVATAWRNRRPTAQGTALGGGIGFHGWADDWDLEGPRRLSWGCVVMRNTDIARVFDRIPMGAMVVIF